MAWIRGLVNELELLVAQMPPTVSVCDATQSLLVASEHSCRTYDRWIHATRSRTVSRHFVKGARACETQGCSVLCDAAVQFAVRHGVCCGVLPCDAMPCHAMPCTALGLLCCAVVCYVVYIPTMIVGELLVT